MSNQPRKPSNSNLPDWMYSLPVTQASWDLQAFDDLIKSQGIKVRHLKQMPDPRGIFDRGENRRDHPVSSSDGNLYSCAGVFTGLFSSNDKMPEFISEGQLDASQALMSPPRFYDGTTEPVIIDVFDRFEFVDIEPFVETSQLITSNQSGRDRLSFPASCVIRLVGSDGFEYKEGEHFIVDKFGDIVWQGQKRPGVNADTNKGEVYGVRYRYLPFWVVRRIIHEIRVTQITKPDGTRYLERLPYQVQIARENYFRDRNRTESPNAPHPDLRQESGPAQGGEWGPQNPDDNGNTD